jgi:hypothetical protein
MKKIVFATLLASATMVASAADFVSIDVDHVKAKSGQESTAQYVRAGKTIGGINFGLQSRTAVKNEGGMLNSLEVTAGNKLGPIAPFVGVGYDNGFNGAPNGSYTYGLIGATTGTKIGPGFALLGVKTRVGSSAAVETKQTVVFGTYSIPVAKNVAFNINAGKSYQDIKEDSYGVGLRFGF